MGSRIESIPGPPGGGPTGAVCSTDGHAEAALVFVWTGVCTLHAAAMFVSVKRQGWRNRVLLPVAVLLVLFYLLLVLLPPGPLSCMFNINCTPKANEALRHSRLYSTVGFVGQDSAANTLHDVIAGAPLINRFVSKGDTAETGEKETISGKQEKKETGESGDNSRVVPYGGEEGIPIPPMKDAAKYIEETALSIRHLWTEEEAYTLSVWMSHAMLYVLLATCIINTLIQLAWAYRDKIRDRCIKKRQGRVKRTDSVPL